MAKHVRAFYTCDFCGVEIDRPYNGGEGGTYSVVLSADYAVAGHTLTFKEMCRSCNDNIGGLISDIHTAAKEMRAARAKESEA